jgi:hypothetical protein
MSVNISAVFTRETRDYNGLAEIEAELLADPDARRLVVAEVDVKFIKQMVDEGVRIPTVRILHVEPLKGNAASTAKSLLDAAYQQRTGRETLPFGDDDSDADDGAWNDDDGTDQ